MEPKSLVFISCGQRKGELEIADRVAQMMTDRGFETYIALKQQTLKGVIENIFNKISQSEYFIFVDFKREKLSKKEGDLDVLSELHRGSLFSHQELAVATYLEEAEILAFQENGVKRDDGILNYIQANCIQFNDRDQLVNIIRDKVEERQWSPKWKNIIRLWRDESDSQIAVYPDGVKARFYHLRAENLHKFKLARNCIAFIEKIESSEGQIRHPPLAELKWRGLIPLAISIPPKATRYLDVFNVHLKNQDRVYLGINVFYVDSDYVRREYYLQGPNDYVLTIALFSDNYQVTRIKYNLHIGRIIEELRFEVNR